MNGSKERIFALCVVVAVGQSFRCGGEVSGEVPPEELRFLDPAAEDARVESASGTTIL